MPSGKLIRFGVIGVGSMGQGHCRTITGVRQTRLTAVCDIDEATAQHVGERHGVPWFTRHRDLIRAGLCDAVIVSTPHPERPPIAIDCVKAGLHLLSEKPLSERVSTADRMIRAARQAKVAFAVMFQRRTEPALAKAIKVVREGRVGRLVHASMVFPDYRTQAYYDSGDWRATWRGEGGGVLLNQAPHNLDLFLQLTGRPVEVTGRVATQLHRIEVEDSAEAMLRFSGGATGHIYCTTNDLRPGERIEIAGDAGKLIYTDGDLRLITYRPSIPVFTRRTKKMWDTPAVRDVPLRTADRPSGHGAIIRNFVRHLLDGVPLIAPGPEGLASLELANAIYLSSHCGKPVRLPLARRAYDAFLIRMREQSTFRKRSGRTQRETDPQHRVQ